jgi:hypothetical protein
MNEWLFTSVSCCLLAMGGMRDCRTLNSLSIWVMWLARLWRDFLDLGLCFLLMTCLHLDVDRDFVLGTGPSPPLPLPQVRVILNENPSLQCLSVCLWGISSINWALKKISCLESGWLAGLKHTAPSKENHLPDVPVHLHCLFGDEKVLSIHLTSTYRFIWARGGSGELSHHNKNRVRLWKWSNFHAVNW